MIRKATLKDIDRILEITKSCARNMIDRNIYQWNEHYPNKTQFVTDIERNELYVIELKTILVACIVIATIMDDEYIPIKWFTTNKNNIYIHRLAVHPNYQGKGIAQKLMTFAESFAKDNGHASVRLDTFSKNKRNQKFYEQRGYKKLGSIYFPKQSEFPFFCYELVL